MCVRSPYHRPMAMTDTTNIDGPETGIGERVRHFLDTPRMAVDDPEGAERMIERTFRPQRRISFMLRPTVVYEHFED